MTTVFIQMRGVVYLLVLLQCCVCVVYANTEGDRKRFLNAQTLMQLAVRDAEKYVPEVEACLRLWKTALPKCVEKCEQIKKLRGEIRGLVEGIKGKLLKPEEVVPKGTHDETLVDLVDRAKKMIPVAGEAARGCSVPVNETRVRQRLCGVYQDNLAPVVEGFPARLQNYEGEKSYAPNVAEAEKYLGASYELYYRATNVTSDIKRQIGNIRQCGAFRDGDWREVRADAAELVRLLKDYGGEELGKAQETEWGKLAGEKEKKRIDQMNQDKEKKDMSVVKGEFVQTENESGFVLNDTARYVGKGNPTFVVNRTREMQEDIRKFKRDLAEAKVEVEFERRLAAEKARKEREEQEKARRAKEEQDRREREERERAKRARGEHEKKAREERERREREEKERRDAEERARLVKEEQEKMAREDAEKSVREQVKKRKDGTGSPALVHSSLILLVLSVLGCTLVC
ncbi:uncharacterized protein TM35_000062570 [Trypanosoma theileri]|uniref:Uncharacterized protein n=1 Tax=Trypanosoma theileri TaxID=67003 RepID=A0A1X0P2W4_9TRYP|nr:uncharacterized protein TM35_000062570 [Trypanosoma theileri]ORC91252.1 hypothetical protein TM35_000062570 [Trypanosoma theileri]